MSSHTDILKEAIVLAGGLGTRLRSAVPDLPKCMAQVANRPFIAHVIEYYRSQGIERFIFSLGYRHEAVTGYLEKNFPELDYATVIEPEPLGTGGAIRLACQATKQPDVTVLNGDTLFRINLSALGDQHLHTGAHCTLSLKPMQHFDRYGVVEMNGQHIVTAFKEKKHYEKGLINGGVYALNVEKFLDRPLPSKFSFEKDYLEAFFGEKHFFGISFDNYFIDIGIPEDYLRAQEELNT